LTAPGWSIRYRSQTRAAMAPKSCRGRLIGRSRRERGTGSGVRASLFQPACSEIKDLGRRTSIRLSPRRALLAGSGCRPDRIRSWRYSRSTLAESVTDILVDRGNDVVVASTARNRGANHLSIKPRACSTSTSSASFAPPLKCCPSCASRAKAGSSTSVRWPASCPDLRQRSTTPPSTPSKAIPNRSITNCEHSAFVSHWSSQSSPAPRWKRMATSPTGS